jgi:hypothetical protein
MLNKQCRDEETLSVVCGCRSWHLFLVVAILWLKLPHVLVGILQVVVAHFLQDLLQVHLTNKANFVRCGVCRVSFEHHNKKKMAKRKAEIKMGITG